MIGILGGTFDPVHFGHLRPALELFEILQLQELRLIPAGEPPHRPAPRASTEQRLEMLCRAIAGQPGFVLDEREIRREGPSYMVDTLQELRTELGEQTSLCLLLGMDAFFGLGTWHRWEDIATLAHLVVSHRPGWSAETLADHGGPLAELVAARRVDEPARLAAQPAGCIFMQPVTQLDISSTRIRSTVAAGSSPRYLLPDGVWELIQKEGLYR